MSYILRKSAPIALLVVLSLYPIFRPPTTLPMLEEEATESLLPAVAKEVIVLVVDFSSAQGDALSQKNLSILEEIDSILGEMEGLRSFESLLTASVVKAKEDEILVLPYIEKDLLESYDPDDAQALRGIYKSLPTVWPFLSEDFETCAYYLEPGASYPSMQLVTAIEDIKRWAEDEYGIAFNFTGLGPIKVITERLITRDLIKYLPLLILTVSTLYFLVFRNIQILLISWLIKLVATSFAFACFRLFNLAISPSILLIIPFNVGLLSDYIIHMYYHLSRTTNLEPRIVQRYLAIPLTLTAATSITGFLSLILVGGEGHILVAVIVSISILTVYGLTLLWLPYLRWKRVRHQRALRRIRRIILISLLKLQRFRYAIYTIFVLILVFLALQVPKLRLEPYSFRQLPTTSSVAISEAQLNEKFTGTIPFIIEVDSRRGGTFLMKANLDLLEKAQRILIENSDVGFQYSMTEVIKRINFYFHDADAAYLRIPDIKDNEHFSSLIEQYLLFYSATASPTEYEALIDASYRAISIQGILKYRDSGSLDYFDNSLRQMKQALPREWNLELHGPLSQLASRARSLRNNWFLSFALGSALIFLTVFIFFKNLKMSLISILPSISILLIVTGLAASLGFDIDEYTIIFVSITMGLTVDYTIHVLNSIRKSRGKIVKPWRIAVMVANGGGVPVLLSFLTTLMAFATLYSSSFSGAVNLAIMFTIAVGSSFVIGVIFLPLLFFPSIKTAIKGN